MKVSAVLVFAATATAMKVSGPPARAVSAPVPALANMAGTGLETGGRVWDPMGFATFSDQSLTWFRACELKHSRVAMLATVGWMANGLGVCFPGDITYGTPFSDLAKLAPLDAWAQVPTGGKLQMIGWAGLVEVASEMGKPHYLKGGDFVTYDWAKQADGRDAKSLLRKQNAELKNGRLAMIGIMSFIAAANIPGSVPMVPH